MRHGGDRNGAALAALLEKSSVLTRDQERWAEALMVERLHGIHARTHADKRIRALEEIGDRAGADRWREIAERLDHLEPDDRADL